MDIDLPLPPHAESTTFEAQDRIYDAWETSSARDRIRLAREALDLWPDCADAYRILAQDLAKTPHEEVAFYREAVLAGERAIGERRFAGVTGMFWSVFETRPYMRARFDLAETLWELDRRAEALGHWRELLRLDESDHMGIRYTLAHRLLEDDRHEECAAFLEEWIDDGAAEMVWTHALLAFRQGGDSPESRARLDEALAGNALVPLFLCGRFRVPKEPPDRIEPEGRSEAAAYAWGSHTLWLETPGAIGWLEGRTAAVRGEK